MPLQSQSLQDDEALARELQRQFTDEYRRSQTQTQTHTATAAAAVSSSSLERESPQQPLSHPQSQSQFLRPSSTQSRLPGTSARTTNNNRSSSSHSSRPTSSSSSSMMNRDPHHYSGSGTVVALPNPPPDDSVTSSPQYNQSYRPNSNHNPLGTSSSSLSSSYRESGRPTTTSTTVMPPRAAPPPSSSDRSASHSPPPTTSAPATILVSAQAPEADAEFARRLQQEIHLEEDANRSRNNHKSKYSSSNKRNAQQSMNHYENANHKSSHDTNHNGIQHPPVIVMMSGSGRGTSTPATASIDDNYSYSDDDEKLARRIEQEMLDEELARRLETHEQVRAASAATRARSSLRPPPRTTTPTSSSSSSSSCTVRRTLTILVPILLAVGVAVGVFLYFTQFNNSLPVPFFPTPEDFRDEDPFSAGALNPDEVEKWRTRNNNNNGNGSGLNLEIVSALTNDWLTYFDKAVLDWDSGVPDTLTLTKSYVAHQTECEPIDQKLIVCNGNYGNTRWRGVNKILIQNGYIVASSAQMNEYYFTGNSDSPAQRQYTMCHEIGHGFGLPHTDESFNNADLGNCMDYTLNPDVNMQPDESNYMFLEELYGVVPGSSNSSSISSEAASGEGNTRRQLHLTKHSSHNIHNNHPTPPRGAKSVTPSPQKIPEWVRQTWRQMNIDLQNHAHGAESSSHGGGWRLLHQTALSEAHEIDIGGGFSIQVHKLLTVN